MSDVQLYVTCRMDSWKGRLVPRLTSLEVQICHPSNSDTLEPQCFSISMEKLWDLVILRINLNGRSHDTTFRIYEHNPAQKVGRWKISGSLSFT